MTRARFVLLFPPALVGMAAFLLYLFEEAIRRGRPFDHLDSYGRGFATWWLDFQVYWGNLGTWTAIGLFAGVFSACWLGKPAAPSRAARPALLGIVAILGAGVVMAVTSAFTGFMGVYNALEILACTWYPHHFPSRLLVVLFVFSGAWVVVLGRRQAGERSPVPVEPSLAGSIALLVASALVLHASAASRWDPATFVDVNVLIFGVAGFLGVVLPLAAFVVVRAGVHEPSVKTGTRPARLPAALLAWVGVVGGCLVVAAIMIPLAFGASTGIVIKAETIARNVMTWVHAALVAAGTHLVACRAKEVSSS